jgi:hydrogenase maturation factor
MLPIGKLPVDLLSRLLEKHPVQDPRVVLGPGIGVDCAVIESGERLLVVKSDPITFTIEDIGWYAVQINANDIATTGAIPRWFLATLLLPEIKTTPKLVETIFDQISAACQEIGASLVGGHTEITHGLDRPILVGTLIGEVDRDRLVKPDGAQPGDRLLLTKGAPIEATAILAREFSEELRLHSPDCLSEDELKQARDFLYRPGIGVLQEARIATQAGIIHAMHDPTEGGIYTALWEMSQACGRSFRVSVSSVPVPELSRRICCILDIDPLAAIASGSLLLAAVKDDSDGICEAIRKAGISCTDIGEVISEAGEPTVWDCTEDGEIIPLPRPPRDAIARLFE